MQNVYGVFGSGTTTISIVAPDCQMPNIVLGVWWEIMRRFTGSGLNL